MISPPARVLSAHVGPDVDRLLEELHRAVAEAEVGAAGVEALEALVVPLVVEAVGLRRRVAGFQPAGEQTSPVDGSTWPFLNRVIQFIGRIVVA